MKASSVIKVSDSRIFVSYLNVMMKKIGDVTNRKVISGDLFFLTGQKLYFKF